MNTTKITYWQDGNYWLGYMNEYPEYLTQGLSFEELIDNLKDIYHDVTCELIHGKPITIEMELS